MSFSGYLRREDTRGEEVPENCCVIMLDIDFNIERITELANYAFWSAASHSNCLEMVDYTLIWTWQLTQNVVRLMDVEDQRFL
jgi:hypothetical protein